MDVHRIFMFEHYNNLVGMEQQFLGRFGYVIIKCLVYDNPLCVIQMGTKENNGIYWANRPGGLLAIF